jgi:hypothetical protein
MQPKGVLLQALSKNLCEDVAAGKQAVKGAHRPLLVEDRARVIDSLDLDSYCHKLGPSDPRWDYLIGVKGGTDTWVVAVEVHPARDDQVDAMISKAKAARRVLRSECQKDPVDGLWHWLASKNVDCSRGGVTERRLKEAGIAFPKTRLSIPRDLSR